jgi:hypothetical protein
MSPRRVRVPMHYKSVPPLQKAEVTGVVGAARVVWLLSNGKTERFDCVVGRGVLGGARRRGRCHRACACRKLCLAFKGLLKRPRNTYMPLSSRLWRPYSIREAHHLLRDNPVHPNITNLASVSRNRASRKIPLAGLYTSCGRQAANFHV